MCLAGLALSCCAHMRAHFCCVRLVVTVLFLSCIKCTWKLRCQYSCSVHSHTHSAAQWARTALKRCEYDWLICVKFAYTFFFNEKSNDKPTWVWNKISYTPYNFSHTGSIRFQICQDTTTTKTLSYSTAHCTRAQFMSERSALIGCAHAMRE